VISATVLTVGIGMSNGGKLGLARRLWNAIAIMLCAILLCPIGGIAKARSPNPPLPPSRPAVAPAQPQPPAPAAPAASPPGGVPATAPSPSPQDAAAACLAKLGGSGVKAEAVPAPPAPLPDCGIAVPVRLSSIALASGAALDLPGRPILDCEFAAVFADYAGSLVAPLAASLLGSQAAAIGTGPGYQCRGRNGVAGAKTSAHGKGIAIDLAEIVLADHRHVSVAHQANAAEVLFMRTMRQAACGWFTTVLGPGSDAAHAEHMHLDILRHGASERYRICD
jgi:hypothetical protein